MSIPVNQLMGIIEGILFAAGRPMSLDALQKLFEEDERPSKTDIEKILTMIESDYQNRTVNLKETASGYQFQVVQDVATWVARLWDEKPAKYSRAALETLALIAYRQPVTRGEIEDVRGVAVSSYTIKSMLEREWIRVVGHRDVPGKPSLYATTKQFLDYFNLKSLDELPTLIELEAQQLAAIEAADTAEVDQDALDAQAKLDEKFGDLNEEEQSAEHTETAEQTQPTDQEEEDGIEVQAVALEDNEITETLEEDHDNQEHTQTTEEAIEEANNIERFEHEIEETLEADGKDNIEDSLDDFDTDIIQALKDAEAEANAVSSEASEIESSEQDIEDSEDFNELA